MKAIMLSNAGKTIAIITNITITAALTKILNIPRDQLESPVRGGASEMSCALEPVNDSIMQTRGRAFKGNFVSGIMAIRTQRAIERARG
jgi:hypothetical protein